MTAGYWATMADVLTFPNGCVSSCFTLNAQEAQGKNFVNCLSSLSFFLQKLWLQVFLLIKWISHCQNQRPVYLFTQILWTNTTSVNNSYQKTFWNMMQKLGEQLGLFYLIFHTNPMSLWNIHFCSSFWAMLTSKNTAWVKTKWAITQTVGCFCF